MRATPLVPTAYNLDDPTEEYRELKRLREQVEAHERNRGLLVSFLGGLAVASSCAAIFLRMKGITL
jgi:hypothetical protein